MTTDATTALTRILAKREQELAAMSAVVGFDGFVDEMIQVVGERRGPGDWTPLAGIPAFADWARAAAGRSALREIVIHRQDPGGCAINLGDGLAALGVGVDCFATLGDPIQPAFAPICSRFRSTHPVGDIHGRTLALEFPDGKLMLSAVEPLARLDADLAERAILGAGYPQACARSRLIALTNWTLYPHMTGVWRLLSERVFQALTGIPILLDLVDPTARSEADLRELLRLLPGLAADCPVTLGVNLNEANILARVLGLPLATDDPDRLQSLSRSLTESIGVHEVVIHALRHAATPNTACSGPFCEAPRKLTGAGDRFNAGYGAGLMLGLDDGERLTLAAAASGWFVRHGNSASIPALRSCGCVPV